MMKKIFFGIIIIAWFFPTQAFAASVTGLVDKGNRLYKDQKFEDALKLYDQALSAQPNSAVINFNEGAAQYKTKEYQQANSSFEKALTTDDKGLEAKANYNLGNSRYMWGVSKENSDLQGAVQLLEGALSNYKRALELTQKDEDAKVNYKIAEEKLKELKEKLKKQPQQNQNNQQQQEQPKPQDQQEQNKDQAQQQNNNKQGQEEKKNEQSASQEKKEEQKEERKSAQEQKQSSQAKELQAQQQPQPQQGDQNAQEQKAAENPEDLKEMSKKEAAMLLDGYRQEENVTGLLKDDQKSTEEKVLKDW